MQARDSSITRMGLSDSTLRADMLKQNQFNMGFSICQINSKQHENICPHTLLVLKTSGNTPATAQLKVLLQLQSVTAAESRNSSSTVKSTIHISDVELATF